MIFRAVLIGIGGVALMFVPARALAHHPGAGGASVDAPAALRSEAVLESDRLQGGFDLAFDYQRSTRVLEPGSRMLTGELFRADAQGLALHPWLRLPSFTDLALDVPFARICVRAGASRECVTGVRDVRVGVAQSFVVKSANHPLRVILRAGSFVTMPTGDSTPRGGLPSDLLVSSRGVQTVSSIAPTLGLGVWALTPTLSSTLLWQERLSLRLATGARLPLNEGSQGVRLGMDWSTSALAGITLPSLRAVLRVGATHLRHAGDRFTGHDSRTSSGAFHETALRGDVEMALSDLVRCGVQARLPVHQEVEGIVVRPAWSARLQCGLVFSEPVARERVR